MVAVKFCLLLVCAIFCGGCISSADVRPPALVHGQHELVDKIYDTQTGQFIDETQLRNRIQKNEYLLLGENHDNGRHHQLQARIINWLGKQPRSGSVSFEMISYKQGELLKQHSFKSSSELIKLLNTEKSNWYYKKDYQVVFDSVLAAGFEILPANIDLYELSQIISHGETKLSEDVRQMLKRVPLSDSQTADLKKEIVDAHCNMIPLESTQSMVLAQRVKDAVMSLSLLNSKAESKVLIAGAGHTRTDRGVPLYLRNNGEKVRILSLAFQEVKTGTTHVDAYSERWDGRGLPFDYVWFTPAVQRPDPCDELKHHFKQQKEKGGEGIK